MSDIFISYSRYDSDKVNELVTLLEQEGYSIWIDRDGIESGDDFKRVILKAIKESKVILFFSSEHSNSSEWTAKEIGVAVKYKKHIIPVKLDNSNYNEAVEFDLINLDYIDYSKASIRKAMWEKLLKTLRNKIGNGSKELERLEAERKAKEEAERARIERERIAKAEAERKVAEVKRRAEQERIERERAEAGRRAELERANYLKVSDTTQLKRNKKVWIVFGVIAVVLVVIGIVLFRLQGRGNSSPIVATDIIEEQSFNANENVGETESQISSLSYPDGTLHALFSVSPTKKVYFSSGNLQYQASTNSWRFAVNQWDCIGKDNKYISSTYDGWIDLFGWGTSGNNHGANCYQPYSTSERSSDYYAYGERGCNLYDQDGTADWGANLIENGGDKNKQWRTLTEDEWNYLIGTRNNTSSINSCKAVVNGVNGLILLPDDWNDTIFKLNKNSSTYSVPFNINIISSSDWKNRMEPNGAVFFPAAGERIGTSIDGVSSTGNYWFSNSYSKVRYATCMYISGWHCGTALHDKNVGKSVRLVCDVQ